MISEALDLPEEFKVQRIRTVAANALAALSPAEVAAHLRANPDIARDVLHESYDKRWSPATFIDEQHGRFWVGWFSSKYQR